MQWRLPKCPASRCWGHCSFEELSYQPYSSLYVSQSQKGQEVEEKKQPRIFESGKPVSSGQQPD